MTTRGDNEPFGIDPGDNDPIPYALGDVQQPREHSVPCALCERSTWQVSGVCGWCRTYVDGRGCKLPGLRFTRAGVTELVTCELTDGHDGWHAADVETLRVEW